MNHPPRVLVTGSSGRVGTAIARRLAHDYRVVGVDVLPGAFTSVVGSIEDPDLLARALQGADAVVHTAALHAPHVHSVPAARFVAVNVDATRSLLELALASGVRRFVYTSSTSVYGHALALAHRPAACEIFNISARSPFQPADCRALLADPWSVITGYFPEAAEVYRQRRWPIPSSIDRVYVTTKAEAVFGYSPRFNFGDLLATLRASELRG